MKVPSFPMHCKKCDGLRKIKERKHRLLSLPNKYLPCRSTYFKKINTSIEVIDSVKNSFISICHLLQSFILEKYCVSSLT